MSIDDRIYIQIKAKSQYFNTHHMSDTAAKKYVDDFKANCNAFYTFTDIDGDCTLTATVRVADIEYVNIMFD